MATKAEKIATFIKNNIELNPKASNINVEDYKEYKIVTYQTNGARTAYHVVIFWGGSAKPYSNQWSTNEQDIIGRVAGIKKTADLQEQQDIAYRASLVNTWENTEVGSIFVSTFGHEQTSVFFYQVVAIKGSTMTVREISAHVEMTSDMTGYKYPRVLDFIGEEIKVRYNPNKRMSINKYEALSLVEAGKKYYFSTYG